MESTIKVGSGVEIEIVEPIPMCSIYREVRFKNSKVVVATFEEVSISKGFFKGSETKVRVSHVFKNPGSPQPIGGFVDTMEEAEAMAIRQLNYIFA